MVRYKVYQYLPGETTAATTKAKTTQLQYKNVISTIQEARGIDKRTWAIRISGTVVGFALTVVGYGLLVARHPQCIIAMPLVGIGLFALMGGLRFTIHAVGIAALSVTWIFFAQESCRLGRAIMTGFFGGLTGAAGWLWLALLSGKNSGSMDLLLLPAGLLAGYAALVTGNKGPGETPTHGQRAWIAMGGCGTSVLMAKAFAAELSMGKLTASFDIVSLILVLLTILIAGAIPMSRHPKLVYLLGFVQIPGDPNKGFDQLLVGGRGLIQVSHQGDIEFQVIRLDFDKFQQTSLAGAKVVIGQTDVEVIEDHSQFLHRRNLRHGAFVNLQGQRDVGIGVAQRHE